MMLNLFNRQAASLKSDRQMHGTLWLDLNRAERVQIFFIEVPYG